MSKINTRPMLITSRNDLPHINLVISFSSGDSTMSISMSYDTCAASNTGFLTYHKNIWKKNPYTVARYERFEGDDPFDPIKVCRAIKYQRIMMNRSTGF